MQVELSCLRCTRDFVVQGDTPVGQALDRIAEYDPWVALGDGSTIEDSLHAALTANGAIHCPECGTPVTVSEQSLSELAREVMTHW